ncbi:MAG: hypothetical protein ACLGSD_01350 [Acidobacteriota bacterium]
MQRILTIRFPAFAIAAIMTISTLSSAAQQRPKAAPAVPSLNLAITYDGTHSGLITSSPFWMQGASAQIEGRFYGGWGAVADIAGLHTASMSSSGVSLDIVTATFGPRYTWAPRQARYEFFGQGLAGVANGFNSVFPNLMGASSTANSLAVKAGGGMNVNLKPHLALRLFEADYLRTQLPNSTNNAQNSLQLGAGIVFRLH